MCHTMKELLLNANEDMCGGGGGGGEYEQRKICNEGWCVCMCMCQNDEDAI
jgi:hypothetical protein